MLPFSATMSRFLATMSPKPPFLVILSLVWTGLKMELGQLDTQRRFVHDAQWSTHLVAVCSGAWRTSGARVQSSVRMRPLFIKKLFQIIHTHTMNREKIMGSTRGFDGVVYNLWSLLTPWLTASSLLAAPAWLKLKGVAGLWPQRNAQRQSGLI